MRLKKFLIFTFIIINFVGINQSYSIEPDVFVQSTVNRASEALNNKYSKEEKIEKLKQIASETVDINGIGYYTLGAYRKNISENEINQYEILFEQYFLKSFSSRLAEYSNPEIEVISKKKLNENYTMVTSILVATTTRPEVEIKWRIYIKDPDNLMIRDLIIEGLSLARTQKEEFSSIISSNNGNIDMLIKNLSDFVGE